MRSRARQRPWVIPRATYRVQLHREFPLQAATQLVPYLHRLGISHLYVSPLLRARPGSEHGYDVIDHSTLNPELGTLQDLEALARALHDHGMGILLDVVPNHMGILADDNAWWLDVLENGPAANHADYFDIDWDPARESLKNRLLVPVLGEPFGDVLCKGELRVEFNRAAGEFSVRYYDHRFPLDPREYPRLFRDFAMRGDLSADDADAQDFESLLGAFSRLPPREDTSEKARAERYRDKEVCKRRLIRLCERSPAIERYIASAVKRVNGSVDDPSSFECLAGVIDAQAYRLAFWRVAGDEINYRRFFDVNTLAALRMGREEVFDATHALILDWIGQGIVDGLRIDHPDGLADPQQYFERLQAPYGAEPHLYVVAEKILADYERLPATWPIHGDTGYEFGALLNAWLVDGAGEEPLTRTYRSFTGERRDFGRVAEDSKLTVMESIFAAEIGMLVTRLDRLAQLDRHSADFTRSALMTALVETLACFPVYRTYVSSRGASDEDRRYVQWAIGRARKRARDIEASVFDFLQKILLNETDERTSAAYREAALGFAMKFQQVSSPVMAKGVEDTAHYRYYRLASLNEVGADPRRFTASNTAVHQSNLERSRRWPHAMLGSSTHDSKRSEDVRARIAVLSEMPERWRTHLGRWNRLNRDKRSEVDGEPAPSRNDEYLIYQTLVGIYTPDAADLLPRLTDYMIKAVRESKVNTSWINPNTEYENGVRAFIERLLDPSPQNAFVKDMESLCETVSQFAAFNSLSQTVLKLTSPGVPDFYQGSEVLELNLVDPDNRRAVDYDRRRRFLDEVEQANPAALLETARDGRLKLFVIWRLLQLRKQFARLFAEGGYEPLAVEGARVEHICAFVRSFEGQSVLVVVPRWFSRLCGGEPCRPYDQSLWQDTRVQVSPALAGQNSREIFTGRELAVPGHGGWDVGELLGEFPVAVWSCGCARTASGTSAPSVPPSNSSTSTSRR